MCSEALLGGRLALLRDWTRMEFKVSLMVRRQHHRDVDYLAGCVARLRIPRHGLSDAVHGVVVIPARDDAAGPAAARGLGLGLDERFRFEQGPIDAILVGGVVA